MVYKWRACAGLPAERGGVGKRKEVCICVASRIRRGEGGGIYRQPGGLKKGSRQGESRARVVERREGIKLGAVSERFDCPVLSSPPPLVFSEAAIKIRQPFFRVCHLPACKIT